MTAPTPAANAVDDLEATLAQTTTVLEGVGADDWHRPTPCPDFDVHALVDHMLTWSTTYADRVGVSSHPEHQHHLPGRHHAADDGTGHHAAAVFEELAPRILTGYRSDSAGSRELPLGIVLMDFLGHTWDLAVATGQNMRVPDSAVVRALDAGRSMLTPDSRGDSFGPEVEPASDATDLERLVAFLGRDPRWAAPAR
ncbi:MAG TPA: TIGR03086 family metal-binding protein [Candidatus Nanopelagicales bacterium]|nr:TIGR03086 family metal-binding protein [Candidatus Nanopelagicales bacterium]